LGAAGGEGAVGVGPVCAEDEEGDGGAGAGVGVGGGGCSWVLRAGGSVVDVLGVGVVKVAGCLELAADEAEEEKGDWGDEGDVSWEEGD